MMCIVEMGLRCDINMNMTKAVKDRFARPCNPCEGCKWYHIKADTEFPCSHCTHNEMHVREEEHNG